MVDEAELALDAMERAKPPRWDGPEPPELGGGRRVRIDRLADLLTDVEQRLGDFDKLTAEMEPALGLRLDASPQCAEGVFAIFSVRDRVAKVTRAAVWSIQTAQAAVGGALALVELERSRLEAMPALDDPKEAAGAD